MRILLLSLLLCISSLPGRARAADDKAADPITFPFNPGDRVAWIGSSSTSIGQYCQCIEFLLRTRHPELRIVGHRFSNVYMDTFAKGLVALPGWLQEFKPTVVFFQYGGNDSVLGSAGLDACRANAAKCVAMARVSGAKVFLITPQGVDRQKLSPEMLKKFKLDDFNLYAEKLIVFGREEGWAVLDTHHPLLTLLEEAKKDDPRFTYTADKTHMTLPGYVAWGYIQYAMLNPPIAESAAEISADGKVLSTLRCAVREASIADGAITFTRDDEILPVLPPVELPPRAHVPLEKYSRYMLTVTGLAAGIYQVSCEGRPVGEIDAKSLAAGANLNSLLLESGHPAPWDEFSRLIWDASKRKLKEGPTGDAAAFERIGKTHWKFEVRRKN